MICEKCGKENAGGFGSGRFCSTYCARSFSGKKTKEINANISNGIKNSEKFKASAKRRIGVKLEHLKERLDLLI